MTLCKALTDAIKDFPDVLPKVGSTDTSLTLTLVTMGPRILQQVISSVSSPLTL